MANRRDFYYRQKVTEAELDAAFDELEAADRAILSDLSLYGVAIGMEVSEALVPNMTVVVAGPGAAYDQAGQRIEFSADQTVNCAVDEDSISTAVVTPGNEKIVSIFLEFTRQLSDPRVDGNGDTVYHVRDEYFRINVVQGAEGASPTAPALRSDQILLADVALYEGMTEILDADISTARREDLVLARYAGGPTWADATTNPAATVEAQLDKIVTDLAGSSGVAKIGAPARTAEDFEVAAGQFGTQLATIVDAIGLARKESRLGAVLNPRNVYITTPGVIGTRAMAFRSATAMVLCTDGSVYRSRTGETDRGLLESLFAETLPAAMDVPRDIAAHASGVVVVGRDTGADRGRLFGSADGDTWTEPALPHSTGASDEISGVFWNSVLSRWVAFGSDGAMYSNTADGTAGWTGATGGGTGGSVARVAMRPSDGFMMAVRGTGSVAVIASADGLTWSDVTPAPSIISAEGVLWDPVREVFVVTGRDAGGGIVWITGDDGGIWGDITPTTQPSTTFRFDVCTDEGVYVGANSGHIYASVDGGHTVYSAVPVHASENLRNDTAGGRTPDSNIFRAFFLAPTGVATAKGAIYFADTGGVGPRIWRADLHMGLRVYT